MKAADLFTLPDSLQLFARWFDPEAAPWTWLDRIPEALAEVKYQPLGRVVALPPGLHLEGPVMIHHTARLPAYGVIQGPAWIGPGCELRPGVYIRRNFIAGANCVLGNSCEFKSSLLLDNVQTPHFNYVGDSIMGNGAHLGAGVICANFRLDQANVLAYTPEGRVVTGRRKLGAILGDEAEAGCNAVLQPGTILGPRSAVLSGTPFAGYLPADTLARLEGKVKFLPRRANS